MALLASVGALLCSTTFAATGWRPAQDAGEPEGVIRARKPVQADASAQSRAAAAAAKLLDTLTIKQTSASAYQQLLAGPIDMPADVTAVAVLMRVDRERWNAAASALADALAVVGKETGSSAVSWNTWAATSEEGAKAVAALRAKLKGMAGPGLALDELNARRDALGTWLYWISYDQSFTAAIENAGPFVTATISMVADGSPLADARVLDRPPQTPAATLPVGVLVDVGQGKATLRRFEVPIAAVAAMVDACSKPLAVQVRALDEAQMPLRSSVSAIQFSRPVGGHWVALPVGEPNPYAISQETQPALFFLPGSFVTKLSGPVSRSAQHLEQMWIGLAAVKMDDAEASRAKKFEIAIVPGDTVQSARASLSSILESDDWAGFAREADALVRPVT